MTDQNKTTDAQTANTMWGGRFAAGPDAIMEAINASISFDQRLYAQDIRGSRAHAAMLAAAGILREAQSWRKDWRRKQSFRCRTLPDRFPF